MYHFNPNWRQNGFEGLLDRLTRHVATCRTQRNLYVNKVKTALAKYWDDGTTQNAEFLRLYEEAKPLVRLCEHTLDYSVDTRIRIPGAGEGTDGLEKGVNEDPCTGFLCSWYIKMVGPVILVLAASWPLCWRIGHD